jgi:hypothetical protein
VYARYAAKGGGSIRRQIAAGVAFARREMTAAHVAGAPNLENDGT